MEALDLRKIRRLALARAGLLKPEWSGMPRRATGLNARTPIDVRRQQIAKPYAALCCAMRLLSACKLWGCRNKIFGQV